MRTDSAGVVVQSLLLCISSSLPHPGNVPLSDVTIPELKTSLTLKDMCQLRCYSVATPACWIGVAGLYCLRTVDYNTVATAQVENKDELPLYLPSLRRPDSGAIQGSKRSSEL